MPARIIIALTLVAAIAASQSALALDQTGKAAGDQMGAYARDRLGSRSGLERRTRLPMTDPATPLRTFDDGSQQPTAMLCGQGSVRSEQAALSVTVTATQVTVQSDTDKDGALDSSSSYPVTRICREGYESGPSYYRWTVNGQGSVGAAGVAQLDGCVDPHTAPPTYAGGKISQLYASATGRTITRSTTSGATVTYYTGRVADCLNQPKDISQTQYYGSPYELRDAGIAAQFTPCPPNDQSCMGYRQAGAGLNAGFQNFSSTSGGRTAVCEVARTVTDSQGPHRGVICEAKRLYYASGYSETNKYCLSLPPSRWDYTSMFRIRCDPYGRELTLEGWATWEGAPCGTRNTGDFPPEPQVTRLLPYGGTSADVTIGALSVNRRVGGDNVAYNDLDVSGAACYSTRFPLRVHLSHACAPNNGSCTYEVRVENAPGCGTFSIPVAPPVGENIADGCRFYEENASCKLIDEQWLDANNAGVATMVNGAATHNTPPETCRTFPVVGTVCKSWWKKQRVYSCAAGYDTARNKEPNTSRAMAVAFSATNVDTATVSYARSSYNREHTQTCLLEITRVMPSLAPPLCLSQGGQSAGCPAGYAMPHGSSVCTAEPTCGQGSALDSGINRCIVAPGPPCPPAFTVNATTGRCEATPSCQGPGTYNSSTTRCEAAGVDGPCTVTATGEARCLYDDPGTKTGLHCDSAGVAQQPDESGRRIVRDCRQMEQCRVSCAVRVPDVNSPSGYVTESRACVDEGGDAYSCPSGGNPVERDCGCIAETWDPALTKGDDCEVGCIVSSAAAPTSDSNVRTDYAVKSCTKADVNGTLTYACPLAGGEAIRKDCACVDTFGMAAGVLGALEQAVKDRQCQ